MACSTVFCAPHAQRIKLLVGTALLGLAYFASGCTSSSHWPDADTLPYTISTTPYPNLGPETENTHVDLDGDGRDEYVRHPRSGDRDPSSRSNVVLYAHGGRTIEQVNFAGQAGQPYFHDLTGNGRLEVLVPVVHDNTLSVHVVDAAGEKLFRVSIMSGSPRQEPDGEIPWFANIAGLWVTDVTGDGNDELVTMATTRLARAPRGVFVHRCLMARRSAAGLQGLTWSVGFLLAKAYRPASYTMLRPSTMAPTQTGSPMMPRT